jgi:hypothetical protein
LIRGSHGEAGDDRHVAAELLSGVPRAATRPSARLKGRLSGIRKPGHPGIIAVFRDIFGTRLLFYSALGREKRLE